jgi:hypothetical protein
MIILLSGISSTASSSGTGRKRKIVLVMANGDPTLFVTTFTPAGP